MAKSPDAFRTISEVAEWLGIQAHVLRFWESKFTQVKPIKRAGGRRYYRPADMQLLGGIKKLLHDDGLTIKGVQKLLREEGMSHVAALSQPLEEEAEPPAAAEAAPEVPVTAPEPEEKGVVLSFEQRTPDPEEAQAAPVEAPKEEAPQDAPADEQADAAPAEATTETVDAEPAVDAQPDEAPAPEAASGDSAASAQEAQSETAVDAVTPAADAEQPAASASEPAAQAAPAPEQSDEDSEAPAPASALPAFLRRPLAEPEEAPAETPAPQDTAEPDAPAAAEEQPAASAKPEPEPDPVAAAPKPRIVDVPPFTAEADFDARPATLAASYRARALSGEQARAAAPLLQQLTALRDSMAARRRSASSPPAQD